MDNPRAEALRIFQAGVAAADPYVEAGVYRSYVVKPFKKVLP